MALRPFWLTYKKWTKIQYERGHRPQAQRVLSMRYLVLKCYYSQFGAFGDK